MNQAQERNTFMVKLRIMLRVFSVLLLCFVCFAIGLSMTNQEAGKQVNCLVHPLEANMIERIMCFNATEKEICSECVYSGLVNLHRLMIEGI